MALGWMSVLKMVPWVDVISSAPAVADGAKKLWANVAKRGPPLDPAGPAGPAESSVEAQAIARLEGQVGTLQAAAAELHQQMLGCTGLIQSLAEQNTQLIRRVEINRLRLLWLAAATIVLALALGAQLAHTLLR